MPSLAHEVLIQLFRDRPALAPELLRVVGVELPEYDEVRTDSADLTQIRPAEYRADLVVLLVRGKPALGIIVEVQLQPDSDKRLSWPVYVTALRARIDCPTCLMVVAPDTAVARWAAAPIDVGPGTRFEPIVLGPSAVPVVRDPHVARGEPELAVLSAMAHADDDPTTAAHVAFAALVACLDLDTEAGLFYADVVRAALRGAALSALEALMQSPEHREFQSEFARKYSAQGRVEGEAKGRVEGEAAAVVRVLDRRGVALTDEQRARILACTDLATVDAWLDRAIVAVSADELFR